MSESKFADKVVIVTGAARGIGRAIALAFARGGAIVAALDIGPDRPELPYALSSKDDLDGTVKTCIGLSQRDAIEVYADVSNGQQVEKAVDQVLAKFGRIDVLVNNAGISTGEQMAHEYSEEAWDIVLAVNLKGVWLCSKYVAPVMIGQRYGKIINISSIAGIMAFGGFASYTASKFGVIGLTKSLAIELAEFDINVNCVCPGIVPTHLNDSDARSAGYSVENGRNFFIRGHLFERLIPPEDIANAVTWLASDESRNVTGIVLPVDAGHSSNTPG
jgi:NAD(P)-dependent dehydrogenase (short-subunit alcohol dehydrogenase family)